MKLWICVSGAALAASFLLPTASAQTLRTISMVDVGNSQYNGHSHTLALAWDDDTSGDPLVAATSGVNVSGFTFTGLDSTGITRTMTKSGISSTNAAFRWGSTPALRVFVDGSLGNSFYNPANPPYFDSSVNPPVIDYDGVPDLLATYGNASFTEILQWGGTATNYLAYYKFRIHGHVAPGSRGYAVLLVETMGQSDYWALPVNFSGTYDQVWMTRGFPAGLGFPQPITVTLLSSFNVNTQNIPEGSVATGTFDFGSTVTLDAIFVGDGDGNPVEGWTLETASDSAYETGDLPLPDTVFEDGFETQVVAAHPTPNNIAPGQCRRLVEALATLHASRQIEQLPALACAPEGRY